MFREYSHKFMIVSVFGQGEGASMMWNLK